MRDSRILGPVCVCAAVFALTGAGGPGCHDKNGPADTGGARLSFEKLKGLVGDWEIGNPKDEAQKGKIHARYHLTAGATAVVETLFPGEPMEMVTVYHRDLDQLMLTHYCHTGNQPRMRTRGVDDSGELVFEFAGGGNLDAARDTHMHGLRMRFVGEDHVHTEWHLFRDGKAAEKFEFDLIRKK